jgi:hypothetical protein
MLEKPTPRSRGFLFPFSILAFFLFATAAHAQAIIKVNDNVNLKFGALVQGWADEAQDATTKGYAQNLFVRRIRFLVAGQVSPNVSFFFETDNPNLGKSPKALASGFVTQDAFIEWKPVSSAFMIDAGMMLPPLCRNCLESAATLLSLDYGTYSFTESAATQSAVGRDTGFMAKGYLQNSHLEYRAGLFQGFRQAAATGRTGAGNPFRATGRVMYNVWDTEVGYVIPGMYLGNKKVLSFGVGADHQSSYKAYSADGFLSMPLANKDAFNGELTLLHFDGGTFLTAIPRQRDETLQAGYYMAATKVMPFLRFEKQDFSLAASKAKNNQRFQAGLTWYPNGNNFNIKGAYSRVQPKVGNNTSELTVQMQFFYF